jgi:ribokinase
MPVVASFGSVNIDHVVDAASAPPSVVDWFPAAGETVSVETVPQPVKDAASETYLGGKGANQAVAAARAEASATFYGIVGRDEAEVRVRSRLQERGIDVANVVQADCPTGAAYILLEADGENRICVLPGANATVDDRYARRVAPKVVGADALLLQNEIPIPSMMTVLDALPTDDGPTVVLDPSPVADVSPLLHHPAVDVVVPNEHEAEVLASDLSTFDGTVVRTAGAGSVSVVTRDGDRYSLNPPSVDPVDATGAGDVLGGYLAAGIARGEAFQDALATAVTAASLSTEVPGAQSAPDLPTVRGRAAPVFPH